MADLSHVVNVLARPDGVGHVSGAGEYQHGEVARFVASSLDGSHFFQRWLIQDTGRGGPATEITNGRYGAKIDDSDPSEATLELPINSNLTVIAEFDDDVRVSLKVMPEKGGTAKFADDSTEMFLSETELYEEPLEIFVSARSGFAFESITCDGSTRRLNYKLEDERRDDQRNVIRATCVVNDPPAGTYLVRFKQVGIDDPSRMRGSLNDRPSVPSPSAGVTAPEPPDDDLSQPAPPSAPPMGGGTGGSADTDDIAAGLSPADIARPSVSAANDIVDVDDAAGADDMRGTLSDDNGSLSSQDVGSRGSLSSNTSLSDEAASEEDEGPSLASQAANMAKDALKEKAKHAAKMKLLALMAHPAFWIVVGVLLAFLLLYACASSCSGNSTDLENGSYSTSSITSDSPSAVAGQVVKQKRQKNLTPRVTGDWGELEEMFSSDDEDNEEDSSDSSSGESSSGGNEGDVATVTKSNVKDWAKRLDKYLEGSNLAGKGTAFAEAALKHGIDPRTSACISHIESGKGAQVPSYDPYNAWGWGIYAGSNGAIHTNSWEEAIDKHAAGLKNGYGSSFGPEQCETYCPGTGGEYWSILSAEYAKV